MTWKGPSKKEMRNIVVFVEQQNYWRGWLTFEYEGGGLFWDYRDECRIKIGKVEDAFRNCDDDVTVRVGVQDCDIELREILDSDKFDRIGEMISYLVEQLPGEIEKAYRKLNRGENDQ